MDDRTTAPRVIIPSEALIEGKSVFLIVDGRAVMRPVRIVRSTTDGVEIEEGLAGGEDIILAPPEDLMDGDRVTREGS